MKNKKNKYLFLFAAICLLTVIFNACSNEEDALNNDSEQEYGKIELNFVHRVNGEPLAVDALNYTNAAGSIYLINEIQYFISDVVLYKENVGKLINEWKDIHYIDTDLPETHQWEVYDKIEAGTYDSIVFTFGITEEKNQSMMFVNPPERDMFWPEYLGGGYHYLKLNGKWKTLEGVISPFDFHLGIGQIYAGGVVVVDSIEQFIHNNFNVKLPNSSFSIAKGEVKEIVIEMNIEKWFESPTVYDHNTWGSYIMQNQEAMQIAKENGKDVFTVKF